MEQSTAAIPGAPALDRGLRVLARLARHGAQRLEDLAHATGWPKPSLLRLLHVLADHGAVRRDEQRRWQAVCALAPMDALSATREQLCQQHGNVLRLLCARLGHTTELHMPVSGGMEMIDRAEPPAREVAIRARIGWHHGHDEFDALTAVLWAFGTPSDTRPAASWLWAPAPKPQAAPRHRAVGSKEITRTLATVRRNGYAIDRHPNSNGVRRAAAPLRNPAGALVAVMAVAWVWAPDQELSITDGLVAITTGKG